MLWRVLWGIRCDRLNQSSGPMTERAAKSLLADVSGDGFSATMIPTSRARRNRRTPRTISVQVYRSIHGRVSRIEPPALVEDHRL